MKSWNDFSSAIDISLAFPAVLVSCIHFGIEPRTQITPYRSYHAKVATFDSCIRTYVAWIVLVNKSKVFGIVPY